MLSIACALMDCPLVLGVDVDSAALEQARENISSFPGLPVELLQADVSQLGCQHPTPKSTEQRSLEAVGSSIPFSSFPVVDCVIMNPPFGSWKKGADSIFLAAAVQVATSAVYSLHKRSTRSHIARLAKSLLGAQSAQVIAELRYDLPATYKHHKCESCPIHALRTSAWCTLTMQDHSGTAAARCACRKKSKDVEVDLWRLQVAPPQST